MGKAKRKKNNVREWVAKHHYSQRIRPKAPPPREPWFPETYFDKSRPSPYEPESNFSKDLRIGWQIALVVFLVIFVPTLLF